MATKMRKTTQATSAQFPPLGIWSSTPVPIGSSTEEKGTTKAGIVYFHACSVVCTVRAGDGRGREAGERRGRRHFGQERVVEDNMVRGEVGHASVMSAGAAITAQMMYEAVTGTASPTIQTDRRRVEGREAEAAAGILDHDGGELEPESRERHHATMIARRGAGGSHVEHAVVPSPSPSRTFSGRAPSRAWKKLTAKAVTVAQNTASVAKKPST